MSLRIYQNGAISEIKTHFKAGKQRVLLVMPTGAGKTVVFCKIVQQTIERGKKAIIITRGRKLVDQASQRLFREHVAHGVMMANHWNYKPHLPVQVCSVDTLIARGVFPQADIVIVDEAHLFGPKGKAKKVLDAYQTFIVSVTATPYLKDGLRHLAEVMVRPIRMQELIDTGFLVPFRYYAPTEPNLEGVSISSTTKDYVNDELEEGMLSGELTGKIIEHYAKLCEGRPTLLFAVNIHHSHILVERFNAEGIRAEHCDADTPDKERYAIIARLESGVTKVVSNVGIFCVGVDIPSLGAVILARPTKSYNLFVQQCGRGTRTFTGKSNCILLDHAGNIKRHGFPTMEPDVDLDGKIQTEKHKAEGKTCKECFCIYVGKVCPECGVEPPGLPAQEFIESEEELIEIKVTTKTDVEQWLEYLEQQRKKSGRKNGWQFHKLIDQFGWEKCLPYLPDHFIRMHQGRYTSESLNPFEGVSPFSGFSRN